MTFADLRALHTIIGDAIDDIQRIYTDPPTPSSLPSDSSYVSPPPSPGSPSPSLPLDFPPLDLPYDPSDPGELLRAHPVVSAAINKIVAASGQISATVQTPFMTLMDASLGYHLPSCLRLLEASNAVEYLREAGPNGLDIHILSQKIGVDSSKLAHILRLLATHHIIREREPNSFTLNRLSSIVDSRKSTDELRDWSRQGRPEMKYHATNGAAALIGLNTDDLMKTSAFMTEAYLLSPTEPPKPPFQYAFRTHVPFFPWLEGEGVRNDASSLQPGNRPSKNDRGIKKVSKGKNASPESVLSSVNPNRFRLERFGAAMQGTGSWEVPGAVLQGFDWRALPRGSTIVDVGGGIGSTSMLLANIFSRDADGQGFGFRFIIQDRPVVVEMGEKAWRAKYPELLDSGVARFQVHDFFTPQPIENASVFLLRVILHDWTDTQARIILERLRNAASKETKLLLGDFVLPVACPEKFEVGEDGFQILQGVEGVEKTLASPPLLANLGKASSHGYWMDMTMQTVFNSQERTLREIVTLAHSAGWTVVRVHRAEGSLFGYVTAVPADIPCSLPGATANLSIKGIGVGKMSVPDVSALLRPETSIHTFGSNTDLPSVHESRLDKFRSKVANLMGRSHVGLPSHPRKKPSPLSLSPATSDKALPSPRRLSLSPQLPKTPPSPMSPTLSQLQVLQVQNSDGRSDAVDVGLIGSQKELGSGVSALAMPPPDGPTIQKAKVSPSSQRRSFHRHGSLSFLPRNLSFSLTSQPLQLGEGSEGGSRKRSGSGFGMSITSVSNFLSSRRSGTSSSGEMTSSKVEEYVPVMATAPASDHTIRNQQDPGSRPSLNLAEAARIESGNLSSPSCTNI